MSMPAHGIQASLACVAVNAFPKLADQLSTLVQEPSCADEEAAPGILDVLASHGGERFGEKDNTRELAILHKWLEHRKNARNFVDTGNKTASGTTAATRDEAEQTKNNHPSFYELFGSSLGLGSSAIWPPALLGVSDNDLSDHGRHTNRDLCRAAKLKWTDCVGSGTTTPSLLFVQGPMPVSTLSSTPLLEFDAIDKQDSISITKKEHTESAQKEYDQCKRVLESTGIPAVSKTCAQLIESLNALQGWLSTKEPETLVSKIQTPAPSCDIDLLRSMLNATSVWNTVLERMDETEKSTRQKKDTLTRLPRYVLRAFLVKEEPRLTDTMSITRYSVVRRFGKTLDAGYYSVLGEDGVCWPTRVSDIRGTVLESMWVCCEQDEECHPNKDKLFLKHGGDEKEGDGCTQKSQGAGINTVVADPDNDIYCDICLDDTSLGYDQIVICDGCERGVHQMCHTPVVTEQDLTQDQWFCCICQKPKGGRTKTNPKSTALSKRVRIE